MNNKKILVDRNFLSELKDSIVKAIASEDGLDGEYLLPYLGGLLDTAARDDEARKALGKINSDEVAEDVKLVVFHAGGSVSTITGKSPVMCSRTDLGGSTKPHPTDERLGIHTQWIELSVTFRLDEVTVEHKPGPEV